MATEIIGYSAASISVIAFGAQFIHTLRCGSVEGLSLGRTVFDTVSLVLWVAYATRVEDIPLLIATSCELVMCMCVAALIVKEKLGVFVITNKDANPVLILQMSKPYDLVQISLSNHKRPQLSDEVKMPPV
jgi:uncharacterized protein with PQ loop repeat